MKKKTVLVIPYGTPKWAVNSENIRAVTSQCKNLEVMYLLPMWGLINVKHFHTSMLSGYAHIPEHKLIQNTAVMLRSWIHSEGSKYKKFILMNYGKGMKFWTKGIAQTPIAKKIKVIRYLPKGDRVLQRRIIWNYNNEKSIQ